MTQNPKKIIILGSTSFAGGWFAKEALDRGFEVTGIARSTSHDDIFLPYKQSENFSRYKEYIFDLNAHTNEIINTLLEIKPNYLVDFAGLGMVAPSWQWPEQWYQTNIVAKSKIQNALATAGFLERYLRVSTPEVYGHTEGLIEEHTHYNPSTPYAVSHAAIDMNLMAYFNHLNFPVILTRFANFYGAHQQLYRIVPRAIFCALTGDPLPLHGGGTSVRAFIHAQDVANGIFAALESGKNGEIYHFSTDKFVTIRELVETIAEMSNVDMGSFVEVTADRPAKDPAYFMSSEKAKSELSWKAEHTLETGLEKTYQWVRENLEKIKILPKDYIHKK